MKNISSLTRLMRPNELEICEKIVLALCNGVKTKDVPDSVGISTADFRRNLHDIALRARLPYHSKKFKIEKDRILHNFHAYKKYVEESIAEREKHDETIRALGREHQTRLHEINDTYLNDTVDMWHGYSNN
ncbi:MAG: hypothetical protein PHE17_20055 [Thiothrix sp.]|uniref:hypothetical protein n=1 Tax=Thiothrix sp. TaxID=1032 RepID=UPI002612DCB4|nr:hypothetical protein [Thiothrix sp.]MDD5395324.1 hypothetical protein [Thiothrix sp.]